MENGGDYFGPSDDFEPIEFDLCEPGWTDEVVEIIGRMIAGRSEQPL